MNCFAFHRVWKFSCDRETKMPAGARIVRVALQGGLPFVWAIVDPKAKPEPRRLLIRGTGHEVGEDGAEYIGTYDDGPFVWHLFEGRP